jgi:hypothetical protein
MNGQFRFLVTVQMVVTMALLGFAWLLRSESPGVAEIVVGATLAHWLRESVSLGQAEREETKAARASAVAEKLADTARDRAERVDKGIADREAAVAEAQRRRAPEPPPLLTRRD